MAGGRNDTYAPGTGDFIPMGDPRIQTDEQGRQYLTMPDGSRSYSQPIGYDAGGGYTYDPSKLSALDQSGPLHKANTWNPNTGQFDKGGLDWGAVGSVLGGAALGGVVAAPAIAGAFGGGGAAGGAGAAGAGSSAATAPTVAGAAGAGAGTAAASTPSWLQALGIGGRIAGGIAAGRAAGRQQENYDQTQYDRSRALAAQMALTAPQERASNAVRGDILANVQDAGVQGPIVHTHGQMPTLTGGLRPSILSSSTRQLGSQMSRDALLSQLKGDPFTPTPPIQAGVGDSILNGIGYAGLGGSLLSQFLPKKNPYQVPAALSGEDL